MGQHEINKYVFLSTIRTRTFQEQVSVFFIRFLWISWFFSLSKTIECFRKQSDRRSHTVHTVMLGYDIREDREPGRSLLTGNVPSIKFKSLMDFLSKLTMYLRISFGTLIDNNVSSYSMPLPEHRRLNTDRLFSSAHFHNAGNDEGIIAVISPNK
jgi:hypothetical protein